MSTDNEKEENCPLAKFCSKLNDSLGKKSNFRQHINHSRAEFLKAIRSVLDTRINDLEDQPDSSEDNEGKNRINVE